MKARKYIFFLIFWTGSVGWLAAQEKAIELNSVEAVWQFGFAQNPDLASYQLQQQKAANDLKAAKGAHLPQISFSGSGQWNADLATTLLPPELGFLTGEPGQATEAQFGTEFNYNAGLNVNQSLFDWQIIQQKRIRHAAMKTSDAQTEAFEQSLKQQLALNYYTALIAEEALAVNERDLQVADSILQLSQEKFEHGLIDLYSHNQAKINVNNLQQNAASSRRLFEQSRYQLKLLLGAESDQLLVLSGQLDPAQLTTSPELVMDKNLLVLEQQLLQYGEQVSLAKGAFAPKLSASAYLGKQQFRDDFGLSFSEGAWSNYNFVSLNLSVPIFSGFSNKVQLSNAKLDQEQARLQLKSETSRARSRDMLLQEEYAGSLITARAALENFKLSEQNSQLSHQKFMKGLISLDSRLRSFDDYLKSENAYLNALSALYGDYATIISRIQTP
ncbi:MAG: TolC family protein [Bacteroidota bacterium]